MKWFSDLSEGAASSLLGQNLTANKALISDANGKVAASDVDASKVGFLSGVTSDVQEQINSLSSAIEVLPSNLMVNAKYNAQAISGIAEYFRYTVIGHICLVEIGGIVLTGTRKSICTELPVAKTRPLGFIQNNFDSSIGTVVYGVIGGAYLNVEYNEKLNGRPLYGCILYFV